MTGDTDATWADELLDRRHDVNVRDRIMHRYDALAVRLAARYRGRGEPREDLEQVARIGLLNALDRFDPERGVRFSTFATVTIVGELKRHLRDRSWSVRAPRSLQERWLEVSRAIDDLTQQLGRSPRIAEIASALDVSDEEVLEALDAGGAYTAASLDAPVGESDDGRLVDLLGDEDPALAGVAPWATVDEAIKSLPDRERHILYLRFFEGWTQSEIGARLGISQMHVSRLLRRTLEELRGFAGDE